jgi:hypothetical protein
MVQAGPGCHWRAQEDLSTSLSEGQWFHAERHMEELDQYLRDYSGVQDLSCLDVFGYSGAIAKFWRQKGWSAEQYDIGLNHRSNDLLGKRGFLQLCRSLSQ